MNENFKADDLNSTPVDAELEKEQSRFAGARRTDS